MSDSSLSQDLLAGRFQPGDSVLHRMGPRWKIFGVGILVVLTAIGGIPVLGGLLLLGITGLVVAEISPAKLWPLLKTFKWFLLAIGVLPALMTPGHAVEALALLPVRVTWEGLNTGAESVFKFTLMILFSMILMRTTAPRDLMPATTSPCGFPFLNRWLEDFFAVGIWAFHLVPLLFVEAEKFILARCATLEGNRWHRFKSALEAGLFLGPLLVHVLSQANRWGQEVKNEALPSRPGSPRSDGP